MYKKTTTIIEEHDTHTSNLPKNIYNGIPNENTDLGINTRINSRHYYSLYAIYLREYLNAVYNKSSTSTIKATIDSHSTTKFPVMLSPWLSNTTQPMIDTLLGFSLAMSNSFCAVIDAIISGKDRDVSIANAKKAIDDYVTNLNSVVYLFQKDKTTAVLLAYLDTIVSQADNRMIKEWALENDSYYTGFIILASTLTPGEVPFADIIANGFMQWQPWRFN